MTVDSATAIRWFEGANSGNRREFISKIDKAEKAYYHLMGDPKTTGWKSTDSANMTLPTTTIAVNRIVPKLASFVMPQGEQIRIPNLDPKHAVYFRDKLRRIKIRKVIKSWIRRTVIDGTGIIYPYWEDSVEQLKDNIYFKGSIEEMELIQDGNKKLLEAMFTNTFKGAVREWSWKGNSIHAMIHDDYGDLTKYKIDFSTKGQEVIMSIVGDRLVYSGLKLDIIPIRNLYFPIDTPTLDDAEFIIHQEFCSPSFLSAFVDGDKLRQARGQQFSDEGVRSTGEADAIGVTHNPETPYISNVVEVWRIYYGTKIAFMLPCVQHIFLEVDLEEEFPRRQDSPRRPFFVAKYLEINDRMVMGWSLPLIMYQYQKELDYLNNLTTDAGDMATSLFGAYKPSGYNLGEPKKIKLERNTLFPTEEPTRDIHFFNVSPNIGWALEKMFYNTQEIERLTSVDEMTLGRGSAKGGSKGEKTLGGMQMMQGQKQEIFMETAWDMRQELDSCLTSMLFLLSRKAPAAELAAIGLNRNSLRSSSVFVDTDLLSAQQVLSRVTSLYQMLRDPLLLQMKVVKPGAFNKMMGKLIKAMGENPDDYIVDPVESDPNEHIQEILAGGMPMPYMTDNHQDHITKEMKAMQASGMEVRKSFEGHIQIHANFLEQSMGQPQEMTMGKYGGKPQPVL